VLTHIEMEAEALDHIGTRRKDGSSWERISN
jgi:hypothetical protein